MKKSRLFIAIALAVVLLITCISAPTFSWFTRTSSSQKQTGEEIVLLSDNAYGAYNGKEVSFETKSSVSGITEPDSYFTGCTASADLSSKDLGLNRRKYFCTTITNASGADQNVSLYAKTLSIPADTHGTLALGVNAPTRSYRDYSSLTNKKYNTVLNYDKRIYFQTSGVDGWESGSDIYVTFGYEYGTKTYKMNYIKYERIWGHIYYCDIPYSANYLFFTVGGWEKANNGQPDYSMRSAQVNNLTNDMSSIDTSFVYRIKNEKDNNNNRPIVFDSINGASIKQYYSSITLATGATFAASAGLQRQEHTTVKYYSSNSGVFTVNEDTGEITGVAAGTATLYTKVIGETYSDFVEKETTITVSSENSYVFYDVPIVKNVLIEGSTENDKNVVKVYWYIINNSLTNTLSYTIDQVYLGV